VKPRLFRGRRSNHRSWSLVKTARIHKINDLAETQSAKLLNSFSKGVWDVMIDKALREEGVLTILTTPRRVDNCHVLGREA
jgi:hypothetical protein